MNIKSSIFTLLISTIALGCSSDGKSDNKTQNTQAFDSTTKGNLTIDTMENSGVAATSGDTTLAIEQTGIKSAPDTAGSGLKKPQPAKRGKWPTQANPF